MRVKSNLMLHPKVGECLPRSLWHAPALRLAGFPGSHIYRNYFPFAWTRGPLSSGLSPAWTHFAVFIATLSETHFYSQSAAPRVTTAAKRCSPVSPKPWLPSHRVLSCLQETGPAGSAVTSEEDMQLKLGHLEPEETGGSPSSRSAWRLERP